MSAGAVATKVDTKEQENIRHLFPLPAVENSATWYPTLRRTLWVLSQLHDFASVRVHIRFIIHSHCFLVACHLRRHRSRGRDSVQTISYDCLGNAFCKEPTRFELRRIALLDSTPTSPEGNGRYSGICVPDRPRTRNCRDNGHARQSPAQNVIIVFPNRPAVQPRYAPRSGKHRRRQDRTWSELKRRHPTYVPPSLSTTS